MTRGMRIDWRLAVRFLSVLALVMVAFAHKPIVLSPAYGADLSAYVLPDGTIPVICHGADAGGKDPHKAHGDHGCEACRISASVLLPAAPDCSEPAISRLAQPVPNADRGAETGRRLRPGAPPQGPPSLPI